MEPVMVNFICYFVWPRGAQIKHYFWVYLWGCFQMRLSFESMNLVKQIALPNVGGHHPIHWGPEYNKKRRKEEVTPLPPTHYLYWEFSSPLLSSDWDLCHWLLVSRAFRLRLNYTTDFLGSLNCRWQIMGLLNLHNCISQFLIINLLIYIYHIYVYLIGFCFLVLFLWRTLTNTDFGTKCVLEKQNFKDEFSELVLRFLELAF